MLYSDCKAILNELKLIILGLIIIILGIIFLILLPKPLSKGYIRWRRRIRNIARMTHHIDQTVVD